MSRCHSQLSSKLGLDGFCACLIHAYHPFFMLFLVLVIFKFDPLLSPLELFALPCALLPIPRPPLDRIHETKLEAWSKERYEMVHDVCSFSLLL